MGPLIPDIISEGWGLVIMFLVGIIFGFILEQAGFSSARKLVGIFYGYDFVVLKVFFTAGITAMIGFLFFQYFGIIDVSSVYIHSNFLWSALIGGVIMGFGFILGGFCPGTSVVAAVIGKIDAWIFLLGIVAGIFIYGNWNDIFVPILSGKYFDGEQIHQTLGISRSIIVLAFAFMALAGFMVGHYFEKKAPEQLKPTNISYRSYKLEAFLLILLALVVAFLPEQTPRTFGQPTEKELLARISSNQYFVQPDEVVYHLMHQTENFRLIDVRTAQDYQFAHLPTSINVPLENLKDKNLRKFLDFDGKVVFISNGGMLATQAWILAQRMGYNNTYILKGGLNNLIAYFFEAPELLDSEYHYDTKFDYRFRQKGAMFLKEGNFAPTSTPAPDQLPKTKTLKSAGGC